MYTVGILDGCMQVFPLKLGNRGKCCVKSKNTKSKFQSSTLNTIVISHQENTKLMSVFYLLKRNFLGGTLTA